MYIDTVGPSGKQYGWLKAIIESRNDDGTFVARYDQGHNPMKRIVTATIKDILDENFIRFYPPVTYQA